ncbi:hypothetical protein [Phascolarctobacterium succinatutens]
MAHIKVEFTQLQEAEKNFSDISRKILQANKDFQTSLRRIDWKVKSKGNIDSRARKLSKRLEGCRAVLRGYSSFINTAYAKYAALENYQKGLDGLGDITPYSNGAYSNSAIPNNEVIKGELEKANTELDMVIKLLNVLKKYLGVNVADGVLSDILGLILTAIEKEKEGVNNISELLSFIFNGGASVISLVEDLVDKGNVHGFGIVKTILSMLDDFLDFKDKGIGEILQGTGGLISSTGKLAEEYLKYNMIQQIVNEGFSSEVAKKAAKDMVKTVGDGLITPLVAFGSSCTRFVGDMIEFTKDENYSIQDFARTLLDSGLSGGSSWIKSLTCGVMNVNVDQVGNYVVDACNSVNDYMEKNNWPTWAKIGGSILGAPVTFGIGLGNMFKGKTLTA